MTDAPIAAPGQVLPGTHNNPPLVEIEALAARNRPAFEAATAVLKAEAALPAVIEGEADLEACAAHVKAARAATTALDGARAAEKLPFDDAAKQVQNLFKPRLDKLAATKAEAERRITNWNRKLEEQRRAEAAAAAVREREEAARREAAAAQIETAGFDGVGDTVLDSAIQSEKAADRLDRLATGSSAADLVRTATAAGTVTSATSMTFEVEDSTALRGSLGGLGDYFDQPSIDKAIRAYIKAQKLAQRPMTLPGVRFFTDSKARVR